MTTQDLKDRTKAFALDIIRLCSKLPNKPEYWTIHRQLVKSGTSVGANYRSACRGKSRPDFIAKLSLVEEEADETLFWLEVVSELWHEEKNEVERLMREANALIGIMVRSKQTARSRL